MRRPTSKGRPSNSWKSRGPATRRRHSGARNSIPAPRLVKAGAGVSERIYDRTQAARKALLTQAVAGDAYAIGQLRVAN